MKRKQEHACVYVCEGVPIGGFECITKIGKKMTKQHVKQDWWKPERQIVLGKK